MYRYEEQPRTNLECNPYPNNELTLVCEVVGPNQFSTIVWIWEPLINPQQTQRLLPSSKYEFQDQASADAGNPQFHLRSQLRVLQLTDSDAGRYFCQAALSDGTLLTPSDKLLLSVQSVYTSAGLDVSPCSNQLTTTNISCSCLRATGDSVTVTMDNRAHAVTTTTLNPQPSPTARIHQPPPSTRIHQPSNQIVATSLPTVQTYIDMELPAANGFLWLRYIVAPSLAGALCVTLVGLFIVFAVMFMIRKKTKTLNERTITTAN